MKNNLADESIDSGFNLFDLYVAPISSFSSQPENAGKRQAGNGKPISERAADNLLAIDTTPNSLADKMIFIFPSSDYVEILNTDLKIEKGVELSRISPLALSLLEIFYWKALIDERDKSSNQDENSQISISTEELAEIFPLRNPAKLEEALKEIESLNRNERN